MSSVAWILDRRPNLEDMPEPPKFCTCGRGLVFHVERDSLWKYHPETGEPVFVPTWRCPVTLRWWNRLSLRFMGHDEFEPDEFFEPYWRRRDYQ